MRKAAVLDGDKTTTGGVVIASLSGIRDGRKKVALDGENATCGNCKGTYQMLGTGKRMVDKRRNVVLDGDRVLCPCGKNRVIVGSNPRVWVTDNRSHSAAGSVGIASALASGGLPGRLAENEDTEAPYPAPASDAQTQPECSYLDGSKGRIDAPADSYKHANNVTVAPGKQTTFDFPGGGTGAATQYDATVNGHPVSVYVPEQSPLQGYGVPGKEEITKALETVPPQQYKNLQRISINPEANSQDAIWQKIYNNPTFSSAATASIDQGVAFYPWKDWPTPLPQQYVDSTMLHETGHLWSEAMWKDPAKKQSWLMASDGKAPSRYAQNNMNEDFAESANMYWSSKGTPCEAEGRKRYPARYGYFDKISK